MKRVTPVVVCVPVGLWAATHWEQSGFAPVTGAAWLWLIIPALIVAWMVATALMPPNPSRRRAEENAPTTERIPQP